MPRESRLRDISYSRPGIHLNSGSVPLLRTLAAAVWALQQYPCLEGQGNLVSSCIMGIIRATVWVIRAINLLTKSP